MSMIRRHHGRVMSPYAGRQAAPLSAEVILVRNFDSDLNPTRPVRQSPLATSQFQGMPLDLIERIRSFPLFRSTPDSFLADIGLLLKPQMNATNDYIITEGDDAKAMYWLVRGAVSVTSRDGESTFAELKPGSFFGEIGILMDRPRNASVVARTKCLLLVLKKDDLRKILPRYSDVERALREEALERMAITEKKKQQQSQGLQPLVVPGRRGSKRTREASDEMDLSNVDPDLSGTTKRRKSPSPGMNAVANSSALGHGLVNVRATLKELPLFSNLPSEILHYLGLNAQPQNYPPFTDIIKQDTMGREVYFIVRGEVEVLDERQLPPPTISATSQPNGIQTSPYVKARLRPGQYFGEVVSLSLADRRTATVRSVSSVECLMIPGDILHEFWVKCPLYVRQQIEETARERLMSHSDNDVTMSDTESTPDIDDLAINETGKKSKKRPPVDTPRVTFHDSSLSRKQSPLKPDEPAVEPSDPDPFSSAGLDNVRQRSRRGSLAPISADEISESQKKRRSPRSSPTSSPRSSPRQSRSGTPSPINETKLSPFFSDPFSHIKRPKPRSRPTLGKNRGSIPEKLLISIFMHLELHELMRLQAVSLHWQNVLTRSPDLLHHLNLSRYNRKITDRILADHICPFVGARPKTIDISNCFHVTDEGFAILANTCGANVRCWRMKSVWDVTAPAILEMANKARGLQDLDLSNCRKVSDPLLARIIGWVVPPSPNHNQTNLRSLNTKANHNGPTPQPQTPAPGTVFGCPELKTLTLSYCKHITDRTMHHIASHAASRIEGVDLTRCTTITDTGFQYWGNTNFVRLKRLCLADCTYLTDQSIVYLTNAARGLRELDLVSFSRSHCPL